MGDYMFKEIRKYLDEYEEVCEQMNWRNLTKEEAQVIDYFDLRLAEAVMKDFDYGDRGEKLAKIILATLGMSNEIKVKIE